jgi:hypothetical protein
MAEPDESLVLRALTRWGIKERSLLGDSSSLSGEELIRRSARREFDSQQVRLLSSISEVLRLMDGLLVGAKDGTSFVRELSQKMRSFPAWVGDPFWEKEIVDLSHFIGGTHLFSEVPEHRQQEPLLFGEERLKKLTRAQYEHLKQKWYEAVFGIDEHM